MREAGMSCILPKGDVDLYKAYSVHVDELKIMNRQS